MTLTSPSQFTPRLALDQLSATCYLGSKTFSMANQMNMTKEKHGKCLRTQVRGDMCWSITSLYLILVFFHGHIINVRQKKNSENTSPRGRVLVGVRASGPRQTNKQAKLSIPPWSSIPRPQG